MMKFIVFYTCLFFLLTGCEEIAVQTTPKKTPVSSSTKLATTAENNFWQTLHQGNYHAIPTTEKLLTAAYLENPNDPQLAAHLGFIHIWKITERQREKIIPPTIVNEIVLAKKYFADAVELNPADARILGFYGDTQLISGDIFHDQREQTRGYFTLQRAIHTWPQFNYFTAGYPMSQLPAQSDHFKEAIEWQWRTLDLCAGEKINRRNPDFSLYMHRETQLGPQRACWNSWIAPYNFEGFFLNMGDMLVKSGDWQTGVKLYQNAKLDKSYSSWPYRKILEKKIILAQQNVKNFQHTKYLGAEKTIMFNSGYGCVMCHQAKLRS